MARRQTSDALRTRPRTTRRPEHLTEQRSRPPIVELRRVTKVYPGGHVGLEHVSLRVDRGEFVFLVGPTGCGKTTLIKTLIREIRPTEGEVLIAGRDIASLSDKKVPQLRRRIGTVFQDYKLLPNRSVYDNVAYALQVIGASRSEIRKKVPDALRLVGLADKVKNYPDQLSGGNLDPNTSIGIMQVLYRINRTGTTVVVVTHDREMVDKMRRRVIQLDSGRVVRDQAAGTYTSDDESTREFARRVREEMGLDDESPAY